MKGESGGPWWLLVGGRQRLGRALAEDLSKDHRLVLTSSAPWTAEDGAQGPGFRRFQWDGEDPNVRVRIEADLDGLAMAGIRLQGAVLVAGTFPEQPLGSWTPENLASTLRTNLIFPMLCAQAIAPRLEEGSCLQLLLDSAIHNPFQKRLPYTAAKAGLACLVPGLAKALAPKVRVVGHALGTALPGDHDDVEKLKEANLLKRIGTPADLARAVRYAADSPYLTGEILTLDGGWRWA